MGTVSVSLVHLTERVKESFENLKQKKHKNRCMLQWLDSVMLDIQSESEVQ